MENMVKENVILVRYAEIHLKGLNRPFFERKLIDRIRDALSFCESARVSREQGRVYVYGISDADMEQAKDKLTKVFGICSISVAVAVEKEWDTILTAAKELMSSSIDCNQKITFKVFAKRSDKRFPMTSDVICIELGHYLLTQFECLTVDVHKPELQFGVEIREKAFLYTNEIPCAGGLPIGTAGRAMLMLSGGIDSPVAGYMLARRGVELSAVHFYSYPYTSERAKDKVIDLARIMKDYTGEIRLHVVPFTEIQLAIHEHCPEKETTLLMRRLMMRISEIIARKDGAQAMITGESLGQVASQTLEAICCTDDVAGMPIFRPLIGMDKVDIIDIAKKIGTFDTSILPFEDCCTVFVPKHPVTRPNVAKVRVSEASYDFTDMIKNAVENTELIVVK